ncbi:MAG: hypothetical protein P4L72_11810 [Parvibaculum sp.]|uniref:hypothetical protein n=1 Tax=Parvibaculum sp. TaxID=2024848 RepID=UPI0028464450|nr:hypothetical protein [Parvibaculum sp.]MDR3499898.1 hypothetical protein [Parvibaculum sp.]
MDTELAGPGAGLSALLLSMGMLFTLVEKHVLSVQEARDAVNLALHNLDALHDDRAAPETPQVQSARNILRAIKMQL